MKHILHKNVSGKKGSDGKTYFQVYVSFTEKRQTYRLKSQLVTRPVTKDEFDNLTEIYDGKISDLLNKERVILFHCRDKNTTDENFDRNHFRIDYIDLTKSLIDIVREVRKSIQISNWAIPEISWELTKEYDFENESVSANSKKKYQDIDLFELEINMLQFQLLLRNNGHIEGLFLMYDWKHGNLKREFGKFLKERHNQSRSSHLFTLLESVMNE